MFLEEKKLGENQVTLEPWRQILLEAAEELDRSGWCQGLMFDTEGRRCAAGAMAAVWAALLGRPSDCSKAESAMCAVVGPIAQWNDSPGRTKEEVQEMMRFVANHHG